MRRGALADVEAVRFHARTTGAVTLIVTLEEKRGTGDIAKSRYSTMVRVEPADEYEMITLPLSLFRLEENQSDPDGALNPELVDTMSIVDLSAILEDTEAINTLRLIAPVAVE